MLALSHHITSSLDLMLQVSSIHTGFRILQTRWTRPKLCFNHCHICKTGITVVFLHLLNDSTVYNDGTLHMDKNYLTNASLGDLIFQATLFNTLGMKGL